MLIFGKRKPGTKGPRPHVCKGLVSEQRHGMDRRELNVFLALRIQTQYQMPKFTQVKSSPSSLEEEIFQCHLSVALLK